LLRALGGDSGGGAHGGRGGHARSTIMMAAFCRSAGCGRRSRVVADLRARIAAAAAAQAGAAVVAAAQAAVAAARAAAAAAAGAEAVTVAMVAVASLVRRRHAK